MQLFEWVTDEENISDLEEYFGAGEQLKEDVNLIIHPFTNETLLHRACSSGFITIVQCLIEGIGSHVNVTDSLGKTPLHYSIQSYQPYVAKYLIKNCGSDLEAKDSNNQTPLELCNQLLNDLKNSSDNNEKQVEIDSLIDIQKVLQKSQNKPIEKRLKIVSPVYYPPNSNEISENNN